MAGEEDTKGTQGLVSQGEGFVFYVTRRFLSRGETLHGWLGLPGGEQTVGQRVVGRCNQAGQRRSNCGSPGEPGPRLGQVIGSGGGAKWAESGCIFKVEATD